MILAKYYLFIAVISVSVLHCQLSSFTFIANEYEYLPVNERVFQVTLSEPVVIDRKTYIDLWIYKNGFVTFGVALEEEAYPILTGSQKINYQPFENLIGENIIGVFITLNKDTFDGEVRAKELKVKSMKETNKKTFHILENLVIKSYGRSVIHPIESVFFIEWRNLQTEGKEEKKNSFRLFILSSDIQSFAIMQYEDIESVSYRFMTEMFRYQSGIRSYANRYCILPFYNISDKTISLEKSSNIAIRDTWLMNLGDTSYNIDMGLPSISSQNILEPQRQIYMPQNDKYYEEDKTKLTTKDIQENLFEKNETNNYSKETVLKKIQNDKGYRQNLQAKLSNQKGQTFIPTTLTQKKAFPSQYDTTTPSEEYKKKGSKLFSDKNGREKISKFFFTKSANLKRNTLTIQSRPTLDLQGTKTTVGSSYNSYFSQRLNTTSAQNLNVKVKSENALLPPQLNNSLNGFVEKIENKLLPWVQNSIESLTSNPFSCNANSCGINKECFVYKDSTCCRCNAETVHIGSNCYRKDGRLKMRTIGSVSMTYDDNALILDLSMSAKVTKGIIPTHVTLQSNRNIENYFRNFILLLYPIFHIPMAFYASPWNKQKVPNLSGLVENIAGINIFIDIEGYGDLYLSLRLNRTIEDQWTIIINKLDFERLVSLNLEGLKLDEKSKKPLYLKYVLAHKSSVDFVEQAVTFLDETKNRTLSIKWRGSMTFKAGCLSSFIGSKHYFVKFADNGYCSSDCTGTDDSICRMMCLGYPYVFEDIPDSCEGNHCPNNMICIEDNGRYDCKCPNGFLAIGESCFISGPTSIPTRPTRTFIKRDRGCSQCSINSNCRILNSQECCLCNFGYVGSGNNCFQRNEQFEINGMGSLTSLKEDKKTKIQANFRILFRQWGSPNSIKYASFVETGKFPYSSSQEKDFVHFIMLLSPIFDFPISLFASDKNNHLLTSLYSLSMGSLNFIIKVGGISPSPISIIFNISESRDSLVSNVQILGYSTEINRSFLNRAQQFFETRKIPDMKYVIRGRHLFLKPYSIKPFGNSSSQRIYFTGSGELDKCSDNEEERWFSVGTQQSLICNARLKDQYYHPYCQAIPILNTIVKASKCSSLCHANAECINNTCVCNSGFSGNGLFCQTITKILECTSEIDCTQGPFFECRNRICSCKPGTMLKDNKCVRIEFCSNCKRNEICEENQCVCKPQYVRNRVSQLCTFDCSLCDIYSTICDVEGCSCKNNFIYETGSNLTCTLKCQSDSDCPANEFCGHLKRCTCPTKRVDGLCQKVSECDSCNKNAVCKHSKCQCLPEWVGDGLTCEYNCSACFNSQYCNSKTGCSCPPNFLGDGKICTEKRCTNCPENSLCRRMQTGYHCECIAGMVLFNGHCVKDAVQIDILPPMPILVNEGTQVEAFCIGTSKIQNFNLTWSRKSGKIIKGNQHFEDPTNKTLRLTLFGITVEDNDEYICRASSGESNSISINADIKRCSRQCHKWAICIFGTCKCNPNYTGDGINCTLEPKCPLLCPDNMICEKGDSVCRCELGFREEKAKCVPDCSKHRICDQNAICDTNSGKCKCLKGYIGDGSKCWQQRESCLLTKMCNPNSSCIKVEEIKQHICVCDNQFIGDGNVCHPKVQCESSPCGVHSFCEPTIVRDHLNNLHQNGKCSCEPGFKNVNGRCEDPRLTNKTLWMSMGEAIISLGINENKSKIRFIDTAGDNTQNNGIIALAGDCSKRRLYWSGQYGATIQSSSTNNMSERKTILSGLGKISGLYVEAVTGNLFFTDSYKGRIGVVDPIKNMSRTLVELDNYHPGQIVAHSPSGKLFWTVNDFLKHRIETSSMNGEQRRVFVLLSNRAIGLAVVVDKAANKDRLCWMEMNDQLFSPKNVTKSPHLIYGFLKCVDIGSDSTQPTVTLIHKVKLEEPSSAFAYSDRFYWGVRKGKYLRVLSAALSKVDIKPNCCDVAIRGLVIMSEDCPSDTNFKDPCISSGRSVCNSICVLKVKTNGEVGPACL